jgi:acyl carrier protein
MPEPTRPEVLKEITASISRLANVPEADIVEGQRLIADLRLDSLAIYELVVDLEERFGMQISNEDAEGLDTVGEAVDYVIRRLAEAR